MQTPSEAPVQRTVMVVREGNVPAAVEAVVAAFEAEDFLTSVAAAEPRAVVGRASSAQWRVRITATTEKAPEGVLTALRGRYTHLPVPGSAAAAFTEDITSSCGGRCGGFWAWLQRLGNALAGEGNP